MQSRLLRAFWSSPSLLVVGALLVVLLWAPVMAPLEGLVAPVTSKVQFVDVHEDAGGLVVRMAFTKNRDCELLGVSVDRFGIPIDFRPADGGKPITLGTGQQLSRPWLLGTTDLSDLRLRWIHRCNPLWTTITTAYP